MPQAVAFTLQWVRGTEDYPVKPRGDTVAISRRLHNLYRPMVCPTLGSDMQE